MKNDNIYSYALEQAYQYAGRLKVQLTKSNWDLWDFRNRVGVLEISVNELKSENQNLNDIEQGLRDFITEQQDELLKQNHQNLRLLKKLDKSNAELSQLKIQYQALLEINEQLKEGKETDSVLINLPTKRA